AVTAARAAGAATVTIASPLAATGTAIAAFTYVPPPGVTSVSPSAGPTEGLTRVPIAGSNFQPGAIVAFGGIAATSIVFNSSTSLAALTPAHSAGGISVIVSNPDGQTSPPANVYTYAVIPLPTVAG